MEHSKRAARWACFLEGPPPANKKTLKLENGVSPSLASVEKLSPPPMLCSCFLPWQKGSIGICVFFLLAPCSACFRGMPKGKHMSWFVYPHLTPALGLPLVSLLYIVSMGTRILAVPAVLLSNKYEQSPVTKAYVKALKMAKNLCTVLWPFSRSPSKTIPKNKVPTPYMFPPSKQTSPPKK